MVRDKARDDKYFNSGEEYEAAYVASLYPERNKVRQFIKNKTEDGTIKYMTHQEVYKLIQKELGYPIP